MKRQQQQADLVGNVKEYQYALMDDPAHRHVRDWLTGTGEGQRGLSPTVLRKYGVGCGSFSFLNDQNQFEPAECVVFPWMVQQGGPSSSSSGSSNNAHTHTQTHTQKDTTTRKTDSSSSSSSSLSENTATWIPRRCKIRAMKQKAWQRLHPTGAGWGLFGLHTVSPDAKEIILTEGL
jgi:twinkle protein